MTEYACMSPDELALWLRESGVTNVAAKIPCTDCPIWFAEQAQAAGCCNRPVRRGLRSRGRRGPPPLYPTVQEQREARRRSARESKRRARCTASRQGAQ